MPAGGLLVVSSAGEVDSSSHSSSSSSTELEAADDEEEDVATLAAAAAKRPLDVLDAVEELEATEEVVGADDDKGCKAVAEDIGVLTSSLTIEEDAPACNGVEEPAP